LFFFFKKIVPSSFDYDSQTQQPVDRWQRKELNHAVVEYIAPTEYMIRPPQPLVYMFVIDVSYPAIQCGMVATAATTILETLDRIPNDEGRTKVGIITVDSSIHFYNLKVTLQSNLQLYIGRTRKRETIGRVD
jgi:protein transport protein SEC24